ncbi:MAG TPA: hypothetical protein VGC54_08370 [Planctomycetota bacterium]
MKQIPFRSAIAAVATLALLLPVAAEALAAPPAGTGGLVLGPLIPGTTGTVNSITVTGAVPGRRIFFVAGFQAGTTGIPGCVGISVDMADPDVNQTIVANGAGEATAMGMVNAGLSGRTVRLQAVQRGDCDVSNLVVHTFP